MIIKEIQYASKGNKVSLLTDSGFSVIIDSDTLFVYSLNEGDEIDEDKITEIIYYDMTEKAKVAALNFVSYRMRSEKEIRDYIRAKGYDDIVRDNVIQVLKRLDYIDDEAYAKAFINDKVNISKHGRKRIEYELRLKGVAEDIIGKVLATVGRDEYENAVDLLRKKYNGNSDMKERRRLYGFLQRRGYSDDTIRRAFEEVFK